MDKELKDSLVKAIEQVITKLTDEAYALLITIINETIYQPQPAGAQYKRTFEFRDKAWETRFKTGLASYIGMVYFDGMRMSPPNLDVNGGLSHGNAEMSIDRRKQMAEILADPVLNSIEAEYKNASGYYGAYHAGDYWTQFLDEFAEKLDKLVITEFSKLGIKVTKVG